MSQLNVPGVTMIPDGVRLYTNRKGKETLTVATVDSQTAIRLLTLGFWRSY